jgi:hypothetical protein
VHYLNSGDWVESKTAIVERSDGRMQLITYDEFRAHLNHQLFEGGDDDIDDPEDDIEVMEGDIDVLEDVMTA